MLISKRRLQPTLAALIGFSLLALHWGVSEYLSVQFVGFAVTAVACVGSLLRNRIRVAVLTALGIGLLSICALAADHEAQLFLKGVRTIVVLVVLLAIRFSRAAQSRLDWSKVAAGGLYVACSVSGALAFLQLLDSFLWGSGAFDIPQDWFALDYGTVLTGMRQELIGSTYFIRPSATFSEPSALAVLALATLVVAYYRDSLFMQVIAVSTALVSCSLLGIAFTGLWLGWQSFQRRSHVFHRSAIAVGAGAVAVIFLMSGAFSARLLALAAGEDVSARVRLAEPVRVVLFSLGEGRYLGVNDAYARLLMSADVTTVFSNWILNQTIYYGLLSPLMIALPFFVLGRRFGFILAVFMVANGDAFYYDRFCLLTIALLALSSIAQRQGRNP